MQNVFFDEQWQCDVKVFSNIAIASEVLAKQLHDEAVYLHEAVDHEWEDRNYKYSMVNEARAVLESRGESDPPMLPGHFLIRYVEETNAVSGEAQ